MIHIAGLSRLGITEAEAAGFASQLTEIVGYVEQLGIGSSASAAAPASLDPAPLRSDVVVEPAPEAGQLL